MFTKRRVFSLLLALLMVFSTITVLAGSSEGKELKWLEEPSIGQVKNKKVEVYGRLEIPEKYKGPEKVKLTVDGFNVVPKKDGSFSKSVFIKPEIEVKVFVGKEEVAELTRFVYYLEDTSAVDRVISMIDALPDVEDLKVEDRDSVNRAREAYDALSDFEKRFVKNIDKLVALEIKMAELVAEEAIRQLPAFEDIRIEHKDAVLAAMELVKIAKELNPRAVIDGEELLAKMLEKIEYLEDEASDDYFFPHILMPFPQTTYYNFSEFTFEGYVSNMKYLDRVLVDGKEADIEYIENAVVRDLDGTVLYTGPAHKFTKRLVLEDGAQIIRIEAISQSGKRGSIARRFWVDTTPPELDLRVKDRDETSDRAEIEVNMRDNFGYMELYLFDSFVYLYDKGHSYNYPSEATVTIPVDLEPGENVFVFTLKDIVGNETVETITITREEEVPRGRVQIMLLKDSSSNKIDFESISNFYIKNKKTGKEYREGSRPWNEKAIFRMDDIPEGEYTIHFDMPDRMYVDKILLGESYQETVYDSEINPLVVVDKGSTYNYVKIILRSEVTLKEILSLDDLRVPADITYDDFMAALPKKAAIIDSEDRYHEVDIKFDVRPYNFNSWQKPGERTIKSKFFTLPLEVSNTVPATRLEVYLKVIFE